ncbi:MAG: LPS export ABC transporter periplasmic protein LptC [Hyphomonadaceae bacterium]
MSLAAQSEHVMALWGPRRAISLKEARQRTALVHILRLLFTIGAVLSAGWLVGTVIESSLRERTTQSSAGGVSVTVHAPRFDGFDSQDRPYTLTAMTAQRRRDNLSLVDLVNPRLKDYTSTTVQAREGVWNAELEVLDLQGDVVMTDAAGYTFTSQKTRMYVKDSRVEGQEPLNGTGPIGEVRADAYEVLEDGNRIVLKGNVWTKFTPKKKTNR